MARALASADFAHRWTDETLAWRLKNPANPLKITGGNADSLVVEGASTTPLIRARGVIPREGLSGSLGYNLLTRWSVDGSLVLDMSRHYYDTLGQTTPIFYPVGYSFGLGYKDDCTTLSLRYSSNVSQPAIFSTFPGGPTVLNPSTRNQTLMIQLVLRTLGDVRTNVGL